MFAIVVLLAPACRHKDGKKFQPSRLAGPLASGQSLATAARKLGLSRGGYEIVQDREPLPSDTRPPYRLLVIAQKDAVLDGARGALELTFYNDRLMTVQLFPADLATARAAIEAAQKISLASDEAYLEPSTRIWVGKDEDGRRYLGWIDKSLQAEQDTWIRQYEK